MPRVLLLATTTGYQTRAFGECGRAAGRRSASCDRPLQRAGRSVARSRPLPIRFSTRWIQRRRSWRRRRRAIDGVLAVGDRPTVVAARVLEGLGLPGYPLWSRCRAQQGAAATRLRDSGLPGPCSSVVKAADGSSRAHGGLRFLCRETARPIGQPRGDSGDSRTTGRRSIDARALAGSDIRGRAERAHDMSLVEGFIPGREFALEGVMNHGSLRRAGDLRQARSARRPIFRGDGLRDADRRSAVDGRAIVDAIVAGGERAGTSPRSDSRGMSREPGGGGRVVLEVAARPIGGLCALGVALQSSRQRSAHRPPISLEELLLRHALGQSFTDWDREAWRRA